MCLCIGGPVRLKMQSVEAAKKLKREIAVIKDSRFLQPVFEPRDGCSKGLSNSPAFNSKYKNDVMKYVLSMRLKRGLDAVPSQNTVLATNRDSAEDSQFIYCLRMDQIEKDVEFDPYILVMVSPTRAKLFSTYFTASIWTITEVQC